jgi:RNA polymerase sigma-70 factor (ECF subfamily)
LEANQPHITKLISLCKKQDKNAQLELYKCYYKAMFNSALRILKDSFEAEDIMQEAFLTAFTKLNTYKGEVAFGAWLKRIVINKSLTQLKKNNRYNEVKLEVITTDEIDDERIDYQNFQPSKVLEHLQGLKDNYRMVLNLYLVEGYDYEEISSILEISNDNVRTTVSRAKRKLKQVLLANNIQNRNYGR